ncbi:MAG: outer membrane lipoprotein-sorting protein [Desulfobacter sp.]|nr:MAG: outer membrane lipoprotein-sorting protein [Desulfobacter sp.]
MKIFNIIFSLCMTLTLACPALHAEPLTAGQVMEAVDNREDGNTLTADTKMILINKNKSKRVRDIKNIRKDYGPDKKGILFFLSPQDVRNTAYMSFDWDDPAREDDSWLYLPALGKVKRIAAGDKSSAFMGSDFSYADINGMEIKDWDYTFAKESFDLKGVDTWVISGRPKPEARERVAEETGYSKILLWVRKDNFVVAKAKYWVNKGKKIKFFKADDIKTIDGIWTPLKLTMVTTAKGKPVHTTVLLVSNVTYNAPVSDNYFTPRRMEQGL